MPYVTPKTDWVTNPKNPAPDDFNRIEGNIDFLKADIETKKGLIVQAINEMGQLASLDDLYTTLYNKIKAISNDADAGIYDVLPPKSFWQGGVKRIGAMATKAAQIYTPGTADQTIAASQYLTGVQTIKGDANLAENNIRNGKTIFGKTGTFMSTISASDILTQKESTFRQLSGIPTYTEMKRGTILKSGTVRVSFNVDTSYNGEGYARIYKNGVPVGTERWFYRIANGSTFTEDFAVNAGDVISLYAKCVGSAEVYCYWLAFSFTIEDTIVSMTL